jgi:hypothetical protein
METVVIVLVRTSLDFRLIIPRFPQSLLYDCVPSPESRSAFDRANNASQGCARLEMPRIPSRLNRKERRHPRSGEDNINLPFLLLSRSPNGQ